MHEPQLIVQPDDGIEPVVALLRSASRELLVKQFTFDHPVLLEEILAQHARGVRVRVLLNGAKATGERINDPAFARLRADGIPVEWSSPRFLVTHEKSVTVDGERALVATFNFMEKYFTRTRDYGVILANRLQVEQIRACFECDWRREPFHPELDTDLGWSPGEARNLVCDVLDSARHTIDIQHPKFAEPVVFERIHAALGRGVRVRILCGGKHGLHQPDLMYSFALWRLIREAGGKLHKQKCLRAHAKLIIVDGKRALISTQNLDQPAFDARREVGVVLSTAHVTRALADVFEEDWSTSRRYDPPDPICPPDEDENEEFTHDADLQHH